MKKLLLLTILGLTMQVNAGWFSDNDKAYYLKHIEEAKEKMKECKLDLEAAMVSRDGDKYKKIMQDKECKSAEEAIKENKKIERAKQEAKDKAEYEKLYKEAIEEFKKMPYDKFSKLKIKDEGNMFKKNDPKSARYDAYKEVKKEQNKKEYNKLFAKFTEEFKKMPYAEFAKLKSKLPMALGLDSKSNPEFAKNNAYEALKEKKLKEAITNLRKEYPKSKLLEYKNKTCKDAMYGTLKYFKCDLARKTFEEEKNLEIKEYLSNKDKLKKDFNECYYKIDKLQKSSKYQEAQKLRNSYTCYMAAQAALKLKIYGYFDPIK